MGGGESGEVSCAELDVGGAARVQLEGGLGKQLGEGACIALAKRSCFFGCCLAMGRGEAILTTGGAPSGALAATVTDAIRFCFAPGTTGVLGLRGMVSLRCLEAFGFRSWGSGRYKTSHGRKTRTITVRLFVRGYNTQTTEKRKKRPKTQCATPHCLEGFCVWAAGAAYTLHLPRHCPQSQPSARRVRGAVSARRGSHPRPADPPPEQ